jgi:hypothetical protein
MFKGTKEQHNIDLTSCYPEVSFKDFSNKTCSANFFINRFVNGVFIDDSLCEENIANARLYFASRDLLEALQNILIQIENEHVSEFMEEFVLNAEKAIAKALNGEVTND